MKIIYCDIDGVLRDLCKAMKIQPTEWNCKIGNQFFMEYLLSHKELLYTAEPTEYFEVVEFISRFTEQVILLSTQNDECKHLTLTWVSRHFNIMPEVIFTENKLDYLSGGNAILIEDSPNLKSYKDVLLIDATYNRRLTLPHTRISTPRQLFDKLLKGR